MYSVFKKYWNEKPLSLILLIAALFRLLSVLFSKGFGMHDDHFLVIEASQSWVDGYDYNNWLPMFSKVPVTPSGHSLLYPGLHYFFFRFLQAIGIVDPQIKMYLVRLLHALYSLLTVYFGYKITLRLSNLKVARVAALLLATLWFMPNLSVRNLVEFVCIPPLLYATWIFVKHDKNGSLKHFIFAGALLGIALCIRFQVSTFIFGVGLAFIVQKHFKRLFAVIGGFLISVSVIQLCSDIPIWGRPFAEIQEYVQYNMAFANDYIVKSWYNYILLLAGILVPPISLFLLFGFLRTWRKHLLVFLPAFVFFVAHSYLASKQERFILPALPFIVILGCVGWFDFQDHSAFWQRNQKLMRNCQIFFWVLNIPLLLVVSVSYSKRSRVESVRYIAHKKDLTHLLIEQSIDDNYTMPPLFYLQNWGQVFSLTKSHPTEALANDLLNGSPKDYPNYVVFNQPDNIEARIRNLKRIFPDIAYEATIQPSFLDNILFKMNKRNQNFTNFIYKINTKKSGPLMDSLAAARKAAAVVAGGK
jgi:hypothetical protein